jgi:hypothetical protein
MFSTGQLDDTAATAHLYTSASLIGFYPRAAPVDLNNARTDQISFAAHRLSVLRRRIASQNSSA